MAVKATTMLLRHAVLEDRVSNNVTVFGVFTRLQATRFPTPAAQYSVYVLLTGDPHEAGELELQCVETTTGVPCAREQLRSQVGVDGKRHVHIRLSDVHFPNEGEYRMVLMFEGKEIGDYVFSIVRNA